MTTICIGRTAPLPCGVNDLKGFAINCHDFLFLDSGGCKIIKWSHCAQSVETIPLTRKYLCFCFDHGENCYWAVPECEPCRIYRLDMHFCEVGHLSMSGVGQQRATGMSCDDCGNVIWISYPGQLAFLDKCSEQVTWCQNADSRRINLGIAAQCACRMVCFSEGSRQVIEVLSSCGQDCVEVCIPRQHQLVGMAACPCDEGCSTCRICVLLSKVCSHELVLVEYCVDFTGQPHAPCHDCRPPKPCPPKPVPHCGGSYEIMHSIALEESGISHILNAEGEKIQKAVATSSNIDELICVNESVKRTLTQVTLLEGMLYSKLEALVSCDDFCHCEAPPCHGCRDCRKPNPCG